MVHRFSHDQGRSVPAVGFNLHSFSCYTYSASLITNERFRPEDPAGAVVAYAPALLQRHADWRVSPSLGATARPEGLLRHGQADGRVSRGPSEFQPGSVSGGAGSGLCFR